MKSGPSSTGLAGFTGTARFTIERPTGDVVWVGAHFNHNIDFRTGRLGASGFVMYNGGKYTSDDPETTALNTRSASAASPPTWSCSTTGAARPRTCSRWRACSPPATTT